MDDLCACSNQLQPHDRMDVCPAPTEDEHPYQEELDLGGEG